MKKYLVLILMIIFIAILGGIIYANSEKTVNGKEELYEKVEEYLVSLEEPNYFLESKDAEPNYDISDFKVFTDIEKLGIKERKNQFHVYVWAKVESYYVQDGKLVSNSGSAAPYEFIIENDVVIDYKKPKDGTEYHIRRNADNYNRPPRFPRPWFLSYPEGIQVIRRNYKRRPFR